jgi:hypothetical protein
LFARQVLHGLGPEAGGAAPLVDLVVAEAESAMGVLAAQPLESVRGEIDDQQPPARPQHARRLGDHARRVLGVMQHAMHGDGVEARLGPGQAIHVGLADLAVGEARALQVGARHDQHVARQVDADAAAHAPGHQREDAAGARADVQEVADALVRQPPQQLGLDAPLVDIERAQLAPARGVLAEVGGGARRPLGADGVEPLAVEQERGIVARQQLQHLAGPACCRPPSAAGTRLSLRQPLEHPGLQQFQMARRAAGSVRICVRSLTVRRPRRTAPGCSSRVVSPTQRRPPRISPRSLSGR